MEVRMLGTQELIPALHLVWDVFVEEVAPFYTPEGVAQFQEFIKYENINRMYQNRDIFLWGAYEEGQLLGVIGIMKNGHICLFFVKKEWQGKGIGKMLYQSAYNYCAQELRIGRVTVNATPGTVAKYQHLGMQIEAPEQEMNGMRFVPMETFVTMSMTQPVQAKKSPALIIAIVAGAVLILIILFSLVFVGKYVYDRMTEPEQEYFYNSPDDYYQEPWEYDEGFGDYDEGAGEPEDSGLEALEAYQADNLSYEIKDEVYEFTDDEKQSTIITFHVSYPQLSSSAGKDYQAVNDAIKACAMATVDEIYTNPTDEVKENVLGSEAPVLADYVSYKVCYASEDFISIAFQDEHAKGDYNLYGGDLRTINIGLKDGKVYEVKDIVDLNDKFLNEWLGEMRDEAENSAFLSELNQEEMKNALAGDSKGGIYEPNFFVCADGIEIGFDLNYPEGDTHDLGYIWVTAPFDFDEIKPYIADEGFWSLLNR